MKTYKYSTKERAERVSKTLGCTGSHSHDENGKKIYMPCKDMKTFKEKTKTGKKTEMTELVDDDGTWSTSGVPILDPASSIQGSSFTDKIVAMSRAPRDPLLRGWYGYYGESELKEEDMDGAFGYEDTKFMDYNETVEYYQKELGLDKESAIERTTQQGKKPNLHKRTPKNIKKKKNFIDRLILKELEDELSEDIILKKGQSNNEITPKNKNQNPILLRNIKSLKKMAEKMGVSKLELLRLMKDE